MIINGVRGKVRLLRTRYKYFLLMKKPFHVEFMAFVVNSQLVFFKFRAAAIQRFEPSQAQHSYVSTLPYVDFYGFNLKIEIIATYFRDFIE
jgi:hypothetical protein